MSLDLHEQEEFRTWILAGHDAKKFPWSSPDHAGTNEADTLQDELLRFGKRVAGGKVPGKSDPWEYAKATGRGKPVFKAHKWVDGEHVGEIYVDADGNEVDVEGFAVVETHHAEALEAAKKVFDVERLPGE